MSTSASDPGHDRHARAQATLRLWLVNVAVGVAIGTAYLRHLPEGLSSRSWVFVGFGLVSSVATLALVPAPLAWLALRWRSAVATGWSQAVLGAAFLAAMKVDTVVFSLLRYHFFSSAVLNVAVTEGSEDAVHLDARVWWPVAGGLVLIGSAEYLAWRFLFRRALGAPRIAPAAPGAFRPVALWGVLLLMIVGVEKSLYAAADLRGDRELPHAAEVLPAYPHLRVSQLLPEGLTSEGVAGDALELPRKGEPLAYPRVRPELDPEGPRPSVLLLVVDSWRADEFSDAVTPVLADFARRGRRFDAHHAGGNGTRFGVFSLLYGLHGSYWFSALEERRSPVLLDVLAEAGYEVGVFSSASLGFPEFRETAFVDHLDAVHDDHAAEEPHQRDVLAARAFEGFLGERAGRRRGGERVPPFFAFVLLDAAHQPYSAPPGGPFQPAAERLDYIELAQDRSPELVTLVRNRYRNALRHADAVAGSVLAGLDAHGEAGTTLVAVTGDHGEEFQESGFWGHTSNFTPEQIRVPFLLAGPGIEPGVETRATSHVDLAPTLLELLGADPALRGEWCLGENLLAPPAIRDLVVAGWGHVGLVAGEDLLRMRAGGRSALDVTVFDRRWRPRPDAALRLEAHRPALERMTEACRRFLAAPEE
jgi:membrane-anchored protein YejM (alkaline phosphatase superfamily)